MSSRLVPLKTHLVEGPMHVKSVGIETSFRWCCMEVRRGGFQLRRAEEVYQGNCRRILQAIELSSDTCPSPMIQLKLSGLLPARLLVRVGDLYTASMDSRLKTVEAIADQMVKDSNQVSAFQDNLDRAEVDTLGKAVRRLKDICERARCKTVRVLVDAECTHLNEGLSALCLGAAAAFNSEVPVVWNTYQCYLKEADQRIREEMGLLSEGVHVCFGAKLVRGAYMLQERQRAQQQSLPDPICDDYSATSTNYDKIASFLLTQAGPRCHFIAATHNEESIQLVIQRMEDEKIDRCFVSFGQLYGMCDQVSYPLAERGFAVYKSVPYGSLVEVLPYLARRALENKGVLDGARKEHALLVKELRTRLLPRPFGVNIP
ncbi:hydroxyproline dehydrogenase [Trichonephila clavipes]|nr:hydroxyproline dehydrogenase [Trichonephila clavipes]